MVYEIRITVHTDFMEHLIATFMRGYITALGAFTAQKAKACKVEVEERLLDAKTKKPRQPAAQIF